jgi:hypothetical protein
MIGKVVTGKYRLESRLGAGGFGSVLLATQLHGTHELGEVVLKFLHANLVHNESVMRRFINEARAARQLSSPHAVKVFDLSFDENGVPFIVMEYVQGESLADVLRNKKGGKLDPARVVRIGVQMAAALGECHEKDIIHRDLKPDNILLLEGHNKDFVKILDFGIARVPSPQGHVTQTMMGTPQYMPPEQILQKEMDGRVDIFALGVILFECFAGGPPIVATTPMEYMMRNCDEKPRDLSEIVSEVPAEMSALLQSMMAKEPEERPQTMFEVRDRLEEIGAWTGWTSGEITGVHAFKPKQGGEDARQTGEDLAKADKAEEVESVQSDPSAISDDALRKPAVTTRESAAGAVVEEWEARAKRKKLVWGGAGAFVSLVLVVGLVFWGVSGDNGTVAQKSHDSETHFGNLEREGEEGNGNDVSDASIEKASEAAVDDESLVDENRPGPKMDAEVGSVERGGKSGRVTRGKKTTGTRVRDTKGRRPEKKRISRQRAQHGSRGRGKGGSKSRVSRRSPRARKGRRTRTTPRKQDDFDFKKVN